MKVPKAIILIILLTIASMSALASPLQAIEVDKVRIVITSGERSGIGLGIGGERTSPGLVYLELLNEMTKVSYKIPIKLKIWKAGALLDLPNIRLSKIMTLRGFEGKKVKHLLATYYGRSLGLSVGLGAAFMAGQSLNGILLLDLSGVTGGVIDVSLLRIQVVPTNWNLIPVEISENTLLMRAPRR